MYKARYYKVDGKKGKARALPDVLFDGVVNEGVMHQAVKAYLANQRQGTAAAKTRSEVSGGNSKPWRQKGTGRARQGATRAVQWEGGGRAFPPIPHSWRQQIPRKVKALARRSALNDRAENDRVVLVDMPSLEKPRTRELAGFLGAMEMSGKVLVLTDGKNENVYLSARNLPHVTVRPFGDESVYDVLWAHTIVIERSAVEKLGEAAADDTAKAPRKTKTAGKGAGKAKAAGKAEAAKDEAAGEDEEEEPAEGAESEEDGDA
jgi:large subunit ribosomal protein L4